MAVRKKSNAVLEAEVSELKDIIKQLSIIIKGDETLGVEGLRVRHEKDDEFKEYVKREFIQIRSDVSFQTKELVGEVYRHTADIKKELQRDMTIVMQEADKSVKEIESHVHDVRNDLQSVKDWKGSWDKAIELMTSSTTWRILFLIGFGIVGLILWFKFQIGSLILNK